MKQKLVLTLPLSIKQTAKKKFILNLNTYRNANFRTLNTVKKNYEEYIHGLLDKNKHAGMFFGKQFSISFIYYHGNARQLDPSNPVSIIEKFACDALTSFGVWEDDNYRHLVRHDGWIFGGIDKENPRCEMYIVEV